VDVARRRCILEFEAFERAARAAFEEIPQRYRSGVDGLIVSGEAVRHPTHAELFTLGECVTETYPSDFDGSDTTRSTVVLHWGSFRELAGRGSDFNWEGELWETLTHELRHHLESLARDDALEWVDYAMEEDVKRTEGFPWDPFYYQLGDAAGPGVRVVESHVFLERLKTERTFLAEDVVRFRWAGRGYEIDRPVEIGDVHFIEIVEGVADAPPVLEIVLLRKRAWWEDVWRLFERSRPRALESSSVARPV